MWRSLKLLLLVVTLAMVINLLVSWFIAWRFDSEAIVSRSESDFTQIRADGTWWQGRFEDALLTGRMQIIADDQWSGDNSSRGSIDGFAESLPWHIQREVLDWCGSLDSPRPRCMCFAVVSRGWPWKAFYLTRDYARSTNSFTVGGGWVVRPASSRTKNGVELPLLPMWPGIALNMAVYVPLVALTLWNVKLWRQWNRYRAGCCPRCGHDWRGKLTGGCAECGWRKQSHVRK